MIIFEIIDFTEFVKICTYYVLIQIQPLKMKVTWEYKYKFFWKSNQARKTFLNSCPTEQTAWGKYFRKYSLFITLSGKLEN